MQARHLESIDFWKGVTILSVLNIHTIFWSGDLYLPDWTKRVSLLIDVPVFFFISGYLLQTPIVNQVLSRGLKQFVRLVIDYAIVFVVALLLAILIRLLTDGLSLSQGLSQIIPLVGLHPIGPLWSIWPLFDGSMWFLFVYFSILPLGILILASPLRHVVVFSLAIPIALFFWASQQDPAPALLSSDARSVAFYLAVFLAGAVVKSTVIRISIWRLLVVWAGVLALTVWVCFQAGGLPDLQSFKFPPSLLYLLFSLHSILMLCLLIFLDENNRLKVIPHWLLSRVSWCGRNSFRIYLWQGIAASVPFLFIPLLVDQQVPGILIYAISLTWTVCVSLAFTVCHNHIETLLGKARDKFADNPALDAGVP